MTKPPLWVYLSLVLVALLSLVSLSFRHRVEQANRTSQLALEMDVIEAFAAGQGVPLDEALVNLREQGLGAVVLSEEYIGELINKGQIELSPGPILRGSPDVMARVRRGLDIRFGGNQFQALAPHAIEIEELNPALFRGVAVGLNPRHTQMARDAGLRIIARSTNPMGAGAETVDETLMWAKEHGADVFLPQGDQVLGRRDALGQLAETLERENMFYASAEFARISGDANIVRDIPERVIRLHAAQAAELDRLPMKAAVERYARAARERNIRILLLRPQSLAAPEALTSLGDFVAQTGAQVRRDGGELGRAAPIADSQVPRALVLAIAVVAVPFLFWVFSSFVRDRTFRMLGLGFIFLLALASWTGTGRGYMALLLAIIFPIGAFVLLDRRQGRSLPVEAILVTLVSLTGGLAVAGMLNALPFFVRGDQFIGVKAAHFLPIAVIGLYFFYRLMPARQALASPITWMQAALGFIILAALMLMLTRTGNENPAAVSGLELRIRDLMDAILFVRPRTKEFLIGHPALIVSIGMLILLRTRAIRTPEASSPPEPATTSPQKQTAMQGKGGEEPVASATPARREFAGWTALALMVAAIGQTSIVNTLAHLHTPLMLGLARIGFGFVVGALLGGVLWLILKPNLVRNDL
jgi:hypothetical protein